MSLLSPLRTLAKVARGAYDRVGDALLLRTVKVAERVFQPWPGIKQLPVARDKALVRFGAPLVDAPVKPDASGPALLLIHGITDRVFGFAFMPLYLHAGDLIARAHRAYGGRVYGYDHPTLSQSPQANAQALAELLPDGVELDIVCHSRGGLVTRALLESDAAAVLATKGIVVRRVVFVGAAAQGSDLAVPDRIAELFRTFPLLAAAAVRPLGEDGVREAGRLRKLLSTVVGAASSRVARLPGVASLLPDSEFIRTLNDSPVPRTAAYSYVRSNFSATGLPFGELCRAAGVVFGGRANDLVVPCDGAVNVGPLRSDPAAPVCDLGHEDQCHHLRYFELEKVQRFIADQLGIAEA